MEVEGPEEDIDKLIMTLEDDTYIVIENMSYKDIPAEGQSYFDYKD